MTTEEMFTKLKEEQNKTKHAHHETTNQIYIATKIVTGLSLLTAVVVGFLAYNAYADRKTSQVRRQIDKALYIGGKHGEKKPVNDGCFEDSDLRRRIDSILSNPYFDWDMRYNHPGTGCSSPRTLADSGTNRFTELLKERRDGPVVLTRNK